ncbi:MAG: DUF4147 domain-containing protein [Thermoplasmata archaeon]|nr:DUF4147 domain-containing protein [Thermoplasmata archaeon]
MPEESESWKPQSLLAAAYRAAVTGADGYRAVRSALRVDRGILRLGNRFAPIGRYREIAFVALGNASASLALAASEALGERLTQGYAAGPVALPESVPFHSLVVPSPVPGTSQGLEASHAVLELAAGLGEPDLLLLLLSPGAAGSLVEPPTGMDGKSWGELLQRASRELGSVEAGLLARVFGSGSTGGRLPSLTGADVETLIVEEGLGGALVGGGPTIPVTEEERARAAALLGRLGEPARGLSSSSEAAGRPAVRTPSRPVVVAGPADAIRSAGDALVDRRWFTRLGTLSTPLPPAAAAALLLERGEAELRALGGRLPAIGSRGSTASQGLAVFAGVTLGGPEGALPAGAAESFLEAARSGLSRRESVVALLPTHGGEEGPGAGRFLHLDAKGSPVRGGLPMRAGITDVGSVALLLLPAPAG